MKLCTLTTNCRQWYRLGAIVLLVVGFLFSYTIVYAATMSVAPATGVYTVGQTFSIQIRLNTAGKTINAAEGTLSFNPNELSVINVSKGSTFNLWTSDPSFSNSAGTISFSGGTPTGYTGTNGVVITATMQAKVAGSPRVRMTNGAVLAADGRGTNILTNMSGGSYTVSAPATTPTPEVVEYVAPANTPSAPQITSSTHNDPEGWYQSSSAELNWNLPADITAVRTLLDNSPNTIPSRVYENPISSIVLSDLEEGVQYFHLQFKNADGWGRVSHYRLAVDTKAPADFTVELAEGEVATNPEPHIQARFTEETSTVRRYLVKVDDAEPFEYIDETGSSTIQLPPLKAGYHIITVEAFDSAGNSAIATISHTVEAFAAPQFIDVPTTISERVIPVIKGMTAPRSEVVVNIGQPGTAGEIHTVTSDDEGLFTVIPNGRFETGVYELTAQATDEFGAQSEVSEAVRMAVQEPNMIRIGALVLSVMSVIVPLAALVILSGIAVFVLFARLRRWRRGISRESHEAVAVTALELTALSDVLQKQKAALEKSRKTKKLTKNEAALITALEKKIAEAKQRITKEVEDVDHVLE